TDESRALVKRDGKTGERRALDLRARTVGMYSRADVADDRQLLDVHRTRIVVDGDLGDTCRPARLRPVGRARCRKADATIVFLRPAARRIAGDLDDSRDDVGETRCTTHRARRSALIRPLGAEPGEAQCD